MSFIESILSHFQYSLKRSVVGYAFYIDGTYYTYSQLSERISAIRGTIIKGKKSHEPVYAIAIHDDLDTYASIFALWMEGKAYVPLHPNQPLERNLNIIEQVGLSNVLDSEKKSVFDGNVKNVIHTSNLQYSEDFLDNWADVPDDELAYILFTSGSTGVPKGVQISRGNLAAFVKSFWDLGYEISDTDRCLQCFDLTFDLSVMSYLIPLLKGACVYTVPYNVVKYMYVVQLMDEHKLTFSLMTPSTIQYLRPYFEEFDFPDMRYSLFCGEALPTEVALEWANCLPNAEIDNVYGPTEDTIFCTWYRLRRNAKNEEHNGILSIGTSMTSGKVVIVDDNNELISDSTVGELCLSGKQLTKGYWKNPAKNQEAFWTATDGTRYYRSGDLCKYGENGDILYVGRKDSQVKINGFRIEISEIEHHAHQFMCNTLIAVLPKINEFGTTSLTMFIEDENADVDSLKNYLSSKMPSYMVPSDYIKLKKFPVNNSNKIDRSALKSMLK